MEFNLPAFFALHRQFRETGVRIVSVDQAGGAGIDKALFADLLMNGNMGMTKDDQICFSGDLLEVFIISWKAVPKPQVVRLIH